jgi:hypothetical protein
MKIFSLPRSSCVAPALIWLAFARLAHADARVAASVQEEFTIAYALPSGEPQTVQLGKGISSVGYANVPTKPSSSTAITVKNAAGETVATGKVADNGSYFLMPNGKGFTVQSAGDISYSNWEPFPGVVIVNTLPERYTIDFFGTGGTVGVKNLKIAKKFDAKQATRLAPGDDSFRVVIHLPDGTTTDGQDTIQRGRFCVIHKTYDDKVTVSSLGYIPSNKKPKASAHK